MSVATKNKVKFNLKNVHYAKLTLADDGTPSYSTPVAIPGAVSLSLDANGEPENFYADGIAYYVINNNMGYDGDLEVALIPESFRKDILKEGLDANGVLVENSEVNLEKFALLFEFDGDQKHIRHALYNCSASRPGIEGNTNEDSKEVQTETLTIKATPLPDGRVKGKTGDTTDSTVYSNWYNAVYLTGAVKNANLSALTIGSLTLDPAFAADTTVYSTATTNDTNAVTATAADNSATVTILVNGAVHTSGNSATWTTGDNTVIVIVTNGASTKTYRVNVSKSAGE
jgi:phi13 family phage major tail protein